MLEINCEQWHTSLECVKPCMMVSVVYTMRSVIIDTHSSLCFTFGYVALSSGVHGNITGVLL